MDQTLPQSRERDAFYERIGRENLSALWNVLGSLVTPEPKSSASYNKSGCGGPRPPLL